MTVVLLYDGDCAFCSTSARALQRWVRPDCLVLPYQLVDLQRWGVTSERAAAEVLLIRKADDTIWVRGGAPAIAGALRLGRQPWQALGALLQGRFVIRCTLAKDRHLDFLFQPGLQPIAYDVVTAVQVQGCDDGFEHVADKRPRKAAVAGHTSTDNQAAIQTELAGNFAA